MNLWVNRIGQLLTLAAALFFLSCQEEVSVLGYKNPNSKFKVSYVEIPVTSSVILRDSFRTSNFSFSGEANRLMVGTYDDDKFGKITASAASQYFTASPAKLPAGASYDSVSLELQFDFYHYGATANTSQSYSVYELDRQLKFDSLTKYFNRSSQPTKQLLGSKSFTMNPNGLDDLATSADDVDSIVKISIPLDVNFGARIFSSAIAYRDSPNDTAFVTYSQFIEQFKGIVIKPDNADKIFGFNPIAGGTRILVHYHTDTVKLSMQMALTGVVGFNQITADRTGTELAGVNQYLEEYLQESENRYIESGMGLLTKVDFSNFYTFLDTIPNIFINSAELVVGSLEASTHAPPPSLVLRALNENNNWFNKFVINDAQDSIDYTAYRGHIRFDIASATVPPLIDNDNVFYAFGDRSPLIGYSSSSNSYSGIMTLLVQQMSIRTDNRSKFKNFVLYPGSEAASTPAFTSASKSVNRVVFPKSGIKLRIYYTKPLSTQ